MHYYQFNIGDYASSTQHLDELEDLAYRRMLDLYYQKEQPLPADVQQIARLIRMRTHCECIEIVLQEFFELTPEGYKNKGAEKVLKKTYSKSEAARKSAQARWNKKKGNKTDKKQEVNANAMRTQCEENADGMLPNTQDPIPNTQEYIYTHDLDYEKIDDLAFKETSHFEALDINSLWQAFVGYKKTKANALIDQTRLAADFRTWAQREARKPNSLHLKRGNNTNFKRDVNHIPTDYSEDL